MLNFILGFLAATCLFLLVNYTRQQGKQIAWWGWLLTLLGILLAVFTVAMILGFLAENAPQAALVMGILSVMVTTVFAVLIRRFVFTKTVH